MPSVYRVYYSPYGITSKDTGPVSSYEVKNISTKWFASAGISTTGSTKATASQVSRLQDVIYRDLTGLAGKLRYVENSLSKAYGRNRTALIQGVKSSTSVYNRVGLTFNGKTYLSLYKEYLTLMDAVYFSAAILRSWTKSTLY